MEWADLALVLRVGKFKEADQWVRLLTLNHGLLTAFAFGGSRSRRRFAGCLDLFNLLEVKAATSKTGSYLNLTETSLVAAPERLRRDWQRQGQAVNCIRFLDRIAAGPDNPQVLFQLTRQMFNLLEQAETCPPLAPLLFRFRLASDLGFSPGLRTCANCGAKLESLAQVAFHVSRGQAFCLRCMGSNPQCLLLDQEALDVLGKVQEYSPEAWSAFALRPEQWRQISRMIDAFLSFHLDQRPDQPDSVRF